LFAAYALAVLLVYFQVQSISLPTKHAGHARHQAQVALASTTSSVLLPCDFTSLRLA
jgi:hypothetical protein